MYREWAPNAVTASLVGDFSKFGKKLGEIGDLKSDSLQTTT